MSSIKCLERALDILELMYQNGGKMTLTEISNALSLYKSTVHRTLLTLAEKDFIQKDEFTGVYTLGSRVFMMGMVAARSIPIGKIARPHLAYLSEKYEEYADLSVLDNGINASIQNDYNNEFVVVFQQYLNQTYSKTLVTPNQCESSESFLPAVYLCFLGFLSKSKSEEELRKDLLKINNRSLRKKWTYEEFLAEIDRVKELGYSYQDSDVKSGYICIAAPIFDRNKKLTAVLSIRGPKTKFSKQSLDLVVHEIVSTANLITEQCKLVQG